MLNSIMSSNNMMVSPHWVATQIGIDIMRSGGNAVEAMIASAAAISVAYPHMNSMGGDNFWLIKNLNKKVFAIEATGASAQKANRDFYISQGHNSIPTRGGLAALTVPGAVGGWENAFNFSKNHISNLLIYLKICLAIGAAVDAPDPPCSIITETAYLGSS